MKKIISLVLILVLGLATMSPAAEDSWTFKNPIPTGRGFTSGAVLDGKIYVIGGFLSHTSITTANEMYDPATDTWTVMEPMPQARCGHATCTCNGKIYVFGGVRPNPYGFAKNNVYEYDPQTDTWAQKADMPYEIAFCGIAVLNDTIYLIGGTTNCYTPPINTVMAYDPVTESWTQKADILNARSFLSACVVDGKIYAFGGGDENLHDYAFDYVEVYDPATNTWTAKTNMPTGRLVMGTCPMNGKIYAVGGWRIYTALPVNEMYDPATDTWIRKSPIQQRRLMFFFGSVGDKIYAIGGSYPDSQGNPIIPTSVEEYDTGLGVLIADFNGDGVVDLDDLVILIESWGTDDPLCDIAPFPDGDGIVDILDLEFFMSYLGQEIGLLAQWKLDETDGTTANDSAGSTQADLYGDPEWRPTDGMVDGALMLDGIDDFVGTWSIPSLTAGQLSVFAWVKGGAPGQVIISQFRGVNWLMADASGGYLKTDLTGTGRSGGQSLISEVTITDGEWHRVGLTWDGSNRVLIVDDVVVASDMQRSLDRSDMGLNIGCGPDETTGTFFSGLVDDVRIYNRAITP
jgi:hypothetical protein